MSDARPPVVDAPHGGGLWPFVELRFGTRASLTIGSSDDLLAKMQRAGRFDLGDFILHFAPSRERGTARTLEAVPVAQEPLRVA